MVPFFEPFSKPLSASAIGTFLRQKVKRGLQFYNIEHRKDVMRAITWPPRGGPYKNQGHVITLCYIKKARDGPWGSDRLVWVTWDIP